MVGVCEMLRNGGATASASVPPLQAETVSIDTAYIPTLMMSARNRTARNRTFFPPPRRARSPSPSSPP